jgi:hypothetical protein
MGPGQVREQAPRVGRAHGPGGQTRAQQAQPHPHGTRDEGLGPIFIKEDVAAGVHRQPRQPGLIGDSMVEPAPHPEREIHVARADPRAQVVQDLRGLGQHRIVSGTDLEPERGRPSPTRTGGVRNETQRRAGDAQVQGQRGCAPLEPLRLEQRHHQHRQAALPFRAHARRAGHQGLVVASGDIEAVVGTDPVNVEAHGLGAMALTETVRAA